MRIIAKNQIQEPLNKVVNRLGRYLYKNLDGAFKVVNTGNTCDVYLTLLYAVPVSDLPKGKEQDVFEMTINLSITTYQDKIRINTLETDPNERTLGFDSYKREQLEDLAVAQKVIFNKIVKHINRAYSEYEVLF